jgi:hypothetical protein
MISFECAEDAMSERQLYATLRAEGDATALLNLPPLANA